MQFDQQVAVVLPLADLLNMNPQKNKTKYCGGPINGIFIFAVLFFVFAIFLYYAPFYVFIIGGMPNYVHVK